MSCKSCTHKEHCVDAFTPTSQYCNGAKHTNADRIRAMTEEELARFFCDEYGCPLGRGYPDCGENPTDPVCMGCWLDWLKQEAAT